MKTIGILGGMSWESTATYYRLINVGVKQRLGGLHSARMLLMSVDFADVEARQRHGDWAGAAAILTDAAQRLHAGGADFLLMATNTMHVVAESVASATSLPLIHIADAAGAELTTRTVSRVGLLGTAYTMELDFYKDRLRDGFGVETIVPEVEDRKRVHDIIYRELCQGQTLDTSRDVFLAIIDRLQDRGAQGILLGCTEIGLLVRPSDVDIGLFDTTAIHADAAVAYALDGDRHSPR